MRLRSNLTAPFALAVALIVVACGGTSVASPSTTATGNGGRATATLPAGASQPTGTGATGSECAAYPAFSLTASPQPSMPVDSDLLSELPTQVAGNPVTDVQAVPFLAFLCYFAGQTELDALSQESTVLGANFASMSFGNFTATVGNNEITVTAMRTPGQDANLLINNFGLLGSFVGLSIAGTGLSDANLGGKNIKISVADVNGSKSYFYVHTDTLFTFTDTSDADAAQVLQALL